MKTKTILIILAIIAILAAIYFITKKPQTDTLDLYNEPTVTDLQNAPAGDEQMAPVVDEQAPVVMEETPVVTPVTPEFPTTGVKPE